MRTAKFIYNSGFNETNQAHSALKVHDGVRVEILSGPWPAYYPANGELMLVKVTKADKKEVTLSVYASELSDIKGH